MEHTYCPIVAQMDKESAADHSECSKNRLKLNGTAIAIRPRAMKSVFRLLTICVVLAGLTFASLHDRTSWKVKIDKALADARLSSPTSRVRVLIQTRHGAAATEKSRVY